MSLIVIFTVLQSNKFYKIIAVHKIYLVEQHYLITRWLYFNSLSIC